MYDFVWHYRFFIRATRNAYVFCGLDLEPFSRPSNRSLRNLLLIKIPSRLVCQVLLISSQVSIVKSIYTLLHAMCSSVGVLNESFRKFKGCFL